MLSGMLPRRLIQLFVGLSLYGVSLALMVRANLGLDPWDVFHQGLSQRLGWSLGTVVNVVGVVVLLLWIALRQRPGLGTVANVLVLGTVADVWTCAFPLMTALRRRPADGFGIALNAAATAAYIGARWAPDRADGR